MEYRLGTCSSCKAQFRVPATFKADQAKCKKCDGVVQLGPVQGASPAPAPAAAPRIPAPARPPAVPPPRPQAKQPAAAKPTGPLPAPKARPAAPPPPAARPKPSPAPTQPSPASSAGAAQPARTRPGKESVRAAAEAAAERVRNAGTSEPGKAGPAVAQAGASGRSGRARVRRTQKQKKSRVPVLAGLGVLLALAAGGGWFLLGRGKASQTQAAETETVVLAEQAGDSLDEIPAAVPEPIDPAAAAPEPEAADEPAQPAEEAPAPPEEIDLSPLPPFEKLPETPDEDWAEYQQLAAAYVDPAAGAAGNRARAKLMAAGYEVMPAVLNELQKVDLRSAQGYQTGDLLQRFMMELCRGNNFDWKHSAEPKDVVFNRKVVEKWHRSWQQVITDRRAWIQLGKLTEAEGVEFLAQVAEAGAQAQEPVGSSDALDDF